MRSALVPVATLLTLHAAQAPACWHEAASRHGVAPQLLYAIARVESGLNPRAVNLGHRERTGSYDIGLMQINSSHLPRLRSFGIAESDLYDPCTSIHVGAWLLADAFARHGVTWDAVGAYNAACRQGPGERCNALRSRYARLVYRALAGARPHMTIAAAGPLGAARVER